MASSSDTFPTLPNRQMDCDEESGLEVPLLSKETPTNLIGTFKVLSFLAGSAIAVASQLLLAAVMWDQSILDQPIEHVVIFSLVWSFWTCAIIFSGLFLLMHGLQRSWELDEQSVIQLEIFNVIGALAAVSVAWFVNDVWNIRSSYLPSPLHQCLWASLCLVVYGAFCAWMIFQSYQSDGVYRRERGIEKESGETQSVQSAFRLMGGFLGVITGACSQFFLASVLWDHNSQQPVLESVLGFSFLWSVVTVIFTSFACASLQFLVRNSQEDETTEDLSPKDKQLTQLRMEASFVSCTLIGICAAWIAMDLFMNMKEQILPSLVLLAASLGLFRLILVCLPEDQCVTDDK